MVRYEIDNNWASHSRFLGEVPPPLHVDVITPSPVHVVKEFTQAMEVHKDRAAAGRLRGPFFDGFDD
jgi:hypothetical protein